MDTETAQPEFERLYHQAFRDCGIMALWNVREFEHPTAADALAITRSLRIEGDLNAPAGQADRAGLPCRCLRFRPKY